MEVCRLLGEMDGTLGDSECWAEPEQQHHQHQRQQQQQLWRPLMTTTRHQRCSLLPVLVQTTSSLSLL